MSSAYHPLSKKQKAMLSQLARQGFDKLYDLDLIDAPGDTKSKQFANWRRREQAEATGESSLTKCVQKDFLPLRAHFNSILGLDDKAFTDHLRSQPATDHSDPLDTPEERQRKLHLIHQALAEQTQFKLGYVIAIARNKFANPNLKHLNTLTTKQLQQLLITLKERIRKAALK
ncbi:hypothetical protein ACFPK9_01055 [Rubritalea spongiae]|uniref:DUF1018 domain-containing protein n=1 Tax=Rubritalea spongiae TaxID=430797 RepID=A0ABW5E085_9BACT